MWPCDVWKVGEEVVDCELKGDGSVGVALVDEELKMLVLFEELVLHSHPHHLKMQMISDIMISTEATNPNLSQRRPENTQAFSQYQKKS